jgi:prolyl-tRNA synthetase
MRCRSAAAPHFVVSSEKKCGATDKVKSEEGKKTNVAQSSWGLTTRSIGTMIMIHADNTGLIMPPRVAQIQVVFVPIPYKDDTKDSVKKCHELAKALKEKGVRVTVDDRKNYKPGNKYAHWELKGVPVRIECGPKDMEDRSRLARCGSLWSISNIYSPAVEHGPAGFARWTEVHGCWGSINSNSNP